MPEVITISIDVTKIEKARIKPHTRKDGSNAKFIDIVLIPRPDDRGNDYMVVQGVTREEREQGTRGPILGNGKIIGGRGKPEAKRKEAFQPSPPLPMTPGEQDVPF